MKPEALHRVIYTSVPMEGLGPDDISAILRTAIANNSEKNITGVLVYGQGLFMQVLEGSPREIRKLIGDIRRDPRHSEMEVQFLDSIEGREFADWAMAYVGADEAIATLDGIRAVEEAISRMKSDDGIAATFIAGLRQLLAAH